MNENQHPEQSDQQQQLLFRSNGAAHFQAALVAVPAEQILIEILDSPSPSRLFVDHQPAAENEIIQIEEENLMIMPPHVGAMEEVMSVNARVSSESSSAGGSRTEPDSINNRNVDMAPEPETSSLNQQTPSAKKRKRDSNKIATTPKKPQPSAYESDDEEGSICPICLDSWEMSGKHRLVSIKCGHLFGQSCIQRWLRECPSGAKVCPSCKSRAATRDIRYIYAKKLTVVDKSEEYRLQELIEKEKSKCENLNMENALLKMELSLQKTLCSKLETQLDYLKAQGVDIIGKVSTDKNTFEQPKLFKLFMEKNVEISREPGCRVMTYAERALLLLVSQKSNVSLFPGYGVKFLDAPTFRPGPFIHVSEKQVRDLNIDANEEYFVAASLDKGAKMFNIHNRAQVATFSPSDQALWAASFNRERPKLLYLGSQNGTTYVYDIRNPNQMLEEQKTDNDMSPIVNICSVPPLIEIIPFGGYLVCKLQSIWFYECSATQFTTATKLICEGPFVAMNYDSHTKRILISTRPSFKNPTARYIIAELTREYDMILLKTIATFQGSKCLTVMSRSAQMQIDGKSLVAAYLQHSKTLTTWNLQNETQMQALSISDVVFDLCPMYLNDRRVCLSALTENRCRIYTVQSSD